MKGYGTYNLPAGTFSDDSSLAFCLAEALTQEFDLKKIADNFVAWLYSNFWTPRGNVFDVGIATDRAIRRLEKGCKPELAGGTDVSDNGNEPQNGFYSFSAESETVTQEDDNMAVRAVVHENQIVENNSTVKLRLLQDIYINGLCIPHGSFVYGTCHFTEQRVKVELTSTTYKNQVFPIALAVFDGMDGLEGISMKGMASEDVARNGASQGLQSLAFSSLDPSIAAQAASASIETAKNLLSRKIKTIRVTLKAGHIILLKGPEKTH